MRNIVTVTFKDNKIIQFEANKYYADPQMKTYTFTYTDDKVRIISCEAIKYIAIDKAY